MNFLSFLFSPAGLGLVAALTVCTFVARLILKKYKPQPVLILGGMTLMFIALLIGWLWGEPTKIIGNPHLPPEHIFNRASSLGNSFFDMFAGMERVFSTRVAGVGLMIMALMGFVKYMDTIGASRALVRVAVKPLKSIRSPYVVIIFAYLIGMFMAMAIASAAGLGVLLMATMFPILISLGVSRGAAVAVIATAGAIGIGPTSGISMIIAETAGVVTSDGKADMAYFFFNYQIPITIPVIITVITLHVIFQRYWDKKEGYVITYNQSHIIDSKETEEDNAPSFYALFALLPLLLVIFFNESVLLLVNNGLAAMGLSFEFPVRTMSLITAIFISIFITMLIEYIRSFDAKKVFERIQIVFDGMGVAFATIITLVIAGEIFATGLLISGSIDTLLGFAKDGGAGAIPITIFLQILVGTATVLMGSGDAAIFSFMSVGAIVAEHFGVNPVGVLMPMQITTSLARTITPISAVIVAVSALAGMNPLQVVKRTAIPMIGGIIALAISSAVQLLM